MSFPLGNFNPNSPVDAGVLAAAQQFYSTLPELDRHEITRCYLHWSVQAQGCVDGAYNVVISQDPNKPGHYLIEHSVDVKMNARSIININSNPPTYAAHTWHRNTGAIGIALDGMDGSAVSPENFGTDPVTVMGLTYLCATAGAVAKKYDVDILGLSLASDPFYGELCVLTHAEAANLIGVPDAYEGQGPYGPPPQGTMERWDLAAFTPGKVTSDTATICGNALRQLAHTYKEAIK